jgi:peptidoglycan/LPS O-acetylase OafA/YrhL
MDFKNRQYHTLDMLRGIASLSVVVLHYKSLFLPIRAGSASLAVDLFFLMSGVVLAKAYDEKFKAGMSIRRFMLIRIIRLFPLYLLGLSLASAVIASSLIGNGSLGWTTGRFISAFVLGIFMLPGPGPTGPIGNTFLFPVNFPTWSLFFELIINVTFASFWPLLSQRVLMAICLISGLLLACLAFGNQNLGAGVNYDYGAMGIGVIRTTFSFFAGVMIVRSAETKRRESLTLFLIIGACVLLCLFLLPAREIGNLLCIVLVFPTIVYFSMIVEPPIELAPAARFMGIASYAIYVLHMPLIMVLATITGRSSLEIGAPYTGIGLLVMYLPAAAFIDSHYDFPIRSYLKQRLLPF